MRRSSLVFLGVAVSLAIRCGSDGESGGASPPAEDVVEDAGGDTAAADTPSGGETDAFDVPVVGKCASDDDCAAAFADLGPCEVAKCSADGTCERDLAATDTPCDDGDACTVGDRCAFDDAGKLTCLPVSECDDGDPCDGVETCDSGTCLPGTPVECSDGDLCNGTETCSADGSCAPGTPLACADDANPCNGAESCDAAKGCISTEVPTCDDGSDCTIDSCDAATGCVHATDTTTAGCCKKDEDCDDGNPCTAATCEPVTGTCKLANVDGACTVADPCKLNAHCDAGACVADDAPGCAVLCTLSGSAGDTVDCPVGLVRLAEAEPPAATLAATIAWKPGAAALTTLADLYCIGPACAENTIPQTSVALQPSDHTVYLTPDNPAAWAGEVQVEISHTSDPDRAINDGWLDDDEVTGDGTLVTLRFKLTGDVTGVPVVLHSLAAGAAGGKQLAAKLVKALIVTTETPCGGDVCWDGHDCTKDACVAEACTYAADTGACDDDNPCTVGEACDAAGDCKPATFATKGSACTGANRCTEVGTCDGGGHCDVDPLLAVKCEASDSPCVTATCDSATGECLSSPKIGATCDDDNACTADDACDGIGQCAGSAITCNDPFGCTTNTCDAKKGCAFLPSNEACDDGNPCTTDSCSATEGCLHAPASGPCDDDDACTLNDACASGECTGAPDPVCGCSLDADCAALEDGNPCNGTLHCAAGTCAVDDETVVTCWPDGYECKEAWACNPTSGACEGKPMTCDDGIACTTDSCVIGEGCKNAAGVDCNVGWICEVSGNKGDLVTCDLRLARGKVDDPSPAGADVRLHWDSALARLDNFTDTACIGAVCFPYDFVTCNDTDTGCTYEKLQPTGHDLVAAPKQKAEWNTGDWKEKIQLLIYHAAKTGEAAAITPSYVTADGNLTGDPLFLSVRFALTADVPAANPLRIDVSDVHFNPASGLPMLVTIVEIGGVRTFVATAP